MIYGTEAGPPDLCRLIIKTRKDPEILTITPSQYQRMIAHLPLQGLPLRLGDQAAWTK